MSTTLSQKIQTLLKDDHIKEAVQLLIEVDWSERDSNWLALVEVLTQLTDEGTDRDTLLLAKKIHQEMNKGSKSTKPESIVVPVFDAIGAKPSWETHVFTTREKHEFQILESLQDLDDSSVEELEALIDAQKISELSPAFQDQIYLRVYGLYSINQYGEVAIRIMQTEAYQKWQDRYAAKSILERRSSSVNDLLAICEMFNEISVLFRKDQYSYLLEQGDRDDGFEPFLQKYVGLCRMEQTASSGDIVNFERETGKTIPLELREFYQTIGAIRSELIGESLAFFGLQNLVDLQQPKKDWATLRSLGIVDMLNFVWSNDKEEFSPEGGWLTQQQIDDLNRRYTAIAYIHVDDNSFVILYFDEKQQFGAVWYDQDDGDIFNSYLYLMLERSLAQHSLWELLNSVVFMFRVPYLEYEQLTQFCLGLRDV